MEGQRREEMVKEAKAPRFAALHLTGNRTRLTTRSYGTVASGTMRLTALGSPLTSPSRTVTGTGGVSL